MTRLDRQAWIEAGLSALAESGVAGTRVELLAKRLKVTKGSFYWHFADRPALLEALVAAWEQHQTARVIALVEAAGGTPLERLEHLSASLTTLDMGLEVAMRNWSATDEAARRAVQAIDAARCTYLSAIIEAAGVPREPAQARARLIYYALIGAMMSAPNDWLPAHQRAMALNRALLLRWP